MERIILALKSLIDAQISNPTSPLNGVKIVYAWDPITINKSNLPAIYIEPVSTILESANSQYDQLIHSIEIGIVYATKDFYTDNPDVDVVDLKMKLIQMVEEIDCANWKYKDWSLFGIIRDNNCLFYDCWSWDVKVASNVLFDWVNYWPWTRPWETYEAKLTINAIMQRNRK